MAARARTVRGSRRSRRLVEPPARPPSWPPARIRRADAASAWSSANRAATKYGSRYSTIGSPGMARTRGRWKRGSATELAEVLTGVRTDGRSGDPEDDQGDDREGD